MKSIEGKRIVRAGLLWASVAMAGVAAPAGAIDVVEPGDYPGASGFGTGSVSAGILELGGNTIAGTLAGQCMIGDCNGSSAGDTQDSFKVTVPSGHKIQELTVTTANVAGPPGFSVSFNLRSPVSDLIQSSFLTIDGTTANLVVTPIGAGEYSISVYGQGASQAGSFSLGWLVTIQVVSDGALFSDGFELGNISRWSSSLGE